MRSNDQHLQYTKVYMRTNSDRYTFLAWSGAPAPLLHKTTLTTAEIHSQKHFVSQVTYCTFKNEIIAPR